MSIFLKTRLPKINRAKYREYIAVSHKYKDIYVRFWNDRVTDCTMMHQKYTTLKEICPLQELSAGRWTKAFNQEKIFLSDNCETICKRYKTLI